MNRIDETVEQLERLYRVVTGRPAPSAPVAYAPIPPDKDPIRHVEEQFDRLIAVLGEASSHPTVTWFPRAAIFEVERETVMQVELPGVPRDSLNVTLHGSILTVSGSRPAPFLGKDGPALGASEIPSGPFTRTFLLRAGVGPEVTARLRDGMLDLRLSRTAPAPASGHNGGTIVVR